jgi:demethylspheroidene O-methyltransferase
LCPRICCKAQHKQDISKRWVEDSVTKIADMPAKQLPADLPTKLSWKLRVRQWRSKMVANPQFQAFCTQIPGLSHFAQSRANSLYGLTAGFVYSQIFASCVSLGVLEALNTAPLTILTLAGKTGLSPDAAERLLSAAESLGLVTQAEHDVWALDDLGAVAANDPGILAMVRHHALLYADLADPVALLKQRSRDTKIARLWAYSANPEPAGIAAADAQTYSELMRVSQDAVAREVLRAHDFGHYHEVVDVGGGHGRFLSHIGTQTAKSSLKSSLQPSLHLFDLPPVAAQGKSALEAEGFGPRLKVSGGSFFDDPLPKGADCYTLVRVLYDHDDEAALRILQAVRAAMSPGASLIIAEPMGGPKGAAAHVNAYFSFYLLAMASGRCRSAQSHIAMLKQAGFASAAKVPTRQPLYTGMVMAKA